MLPPIEINRFNLKIVIALLVLVAYTPNVRAHNDHNPSNQDASIKTVPYVEYHIEHNISQSDAKRSFFDVGVKLLDEKPLKWCVQCTEHINKYCLSDTMWDDHCCCDSRHGTEPIPWIPHSCYVGDGCRPSMGSCVNYTEIRECCCDRVLAKKWKSIYSGSVMTTVNVFAQLVCVVLLIARSSSEWTM